MQSIMVVQVSFKVSFTTKFACTFGAEMVLRSMFLRFPLLLVPRVLCLFSISWKREGRDGKVYFSPIDQTRIVPNIKTIHSFLCSLLFQNNKLLFCHLFSRKLRISVFYKVISFMRGIYCLNFLFWFKCVHKGIELKG